ncbi:MAG TPA: DUF1232 domain-containing protein [Candidatus Limnocylindria bacterium]|nr:DUF1232 domain-containing protein [Candidatus Limnocylindria bacterium]
MSQPKPADATDPQAATHGFPREEFGALLRRLPAYGRLAFALARDPRLSRVRRAAVLAAAGYVVSPIDLVPGIIPVVGQLDDLAVALAAIRFALDGLKPEVRAERLAAVGLAPADVEQDLQTTRSIAVWLGRTGLRTGRRLAGAAADAGGRAARGALAAGRNVRERMRRPH